MSATITSQSTFAQSLTDYTKYCLQEGDTLRITIDPFTMCGRTVKDIEKLMAAGVTFDNHYGWNIVVTGIEGLNEIADKLDGYEMNGFYRVHK